MTIHETDIQRSPIRPAVITARKTGYVYRAIVTWCNEYLTDANGNVYEGSKAVDMLREADGPMIVTRDVGSLLNLITKHDNHPSYALSARLTDAAPADPNEPWISKARLVGFGWKRTTDNRNHARQTVVLDVARFVSSPGVSATLCENTHGELFAFGSDVRDWCRENDLPIRTSAAGLAATLTRDKRFIGDSICRVPAATNENVRKFLPGVYMAALAPTNVRYANATGLDQRRAYHRGAQKLPIADPACLYARGFYTTFNENPEDLWLTPKDHEWPGLIQEHGLFVFRATCSKKPSKFAPPAVHLAYGNPLGTSVHVWSVELAECLRHGMVLEGAYCAWTTSSVDQSYPLYGRWAEDQINGAQSSRALWLKPTLHARYGLAGSRQRRLIIGSTVSQSETRADWLVSGQQINVGTYELKASAPPTTHVVALGTLQAYVRTETLRMAQHCDDMGLDVLHVHADGLHIAGEQLPMLGPDWTAEHVTGLRYVDSVSWTSDQRDVLPGRDLRARVRVGARVTDREYALQDRTRPGN